jgi:hypothetical protein
MKGHRGQELAGQIHLEATARRLKNKRRAIIERLKQRYLFLKQQHEAEQEEKREETA